MGENNLYNLIVKKVSSYPNIILGITSTEKISFSKTTNTTDYSSYYKSAIVLAVPHKEIMLLNSYSEEKLDNLILDARDVINNVLNSLLQLFRERDVDYFIPPVAQDNENDLIAPISFKYAAVNAGIGWIGKNGVLITKEYGPRVRLSCILVNSNLPAGIPITKSLCDESCFLCVDVCPHSALKGATWSIGTTRDELIDYKLCNYKRSLFLKNHNRKNACGLCIVVCPFGA